eukprot:TRINITY_DN4188_c0_g2_i1.p2 TRINITY_DN4188_c0_g2~~TRINITY_DN4188_c0_g2_i1.p2  ORF type:complete len:256 (+),score=45.91 TRINITY_DN4188_c0_g2_i1:1277-2044(+)
MKTLKDDMMGAFSLEAGMLQTLRHPNIIQFYGIAEYASIRYMVCELATGCIRDLVRSADLTTQQLLCACKDVAAGMNYLSSSVYPPVLHMDLAARNILYKQYPDSYEAKICDFGLSKFYENKAYDICNQKISPRWAAYEVLTEHKFTTASDVWSFGVVIWELFSKGAIPYESRNTRAELMQFLADGKRLECPPGCPAAVYKFLQGCWDQGQQQRPTFQDAVKLFTGLVGIPTACSPQSNWKPAAANYDYPSSSSS